MRLADSDFRLVDNESLHSGEHQPRVAFTARGGLACRGLLFLPRRQHHKQKTRRNNSTLTFTAHG